MTKTVHDPQRIELIAEAMKRYAEYQDAVSVVDLKLVHTVTDVVRAGIDYGYAWGVLHTYETLYGFSHTPFPES